MNIVRTLLIKRPVYLVRNYATTTKFVEITQDEKTGISTISMAKPPVNTLNRGFLTELRTSFIELQKNKSKGVILTSSIPSIFSGGFDIAELCEVDLNKLTEFWCNVQNLWLTLYTLELPTAAAINGSAPGAGCLLASSCEYRVFVEADYIIGLNELQLGIIPPQWFMDIYISLLGYRQAELAILRGTLFKPQAALSVGLVDELAVDKANAIMKCENYINYFSKTSREARNLTKLMLRKKVLSRLEENREEDLNAFLNFIQTPKVQKGLHVYLKSLGQKDAKK